MRSTDPLSTGMHIAIPLSGASAADTGRVALPESPCCRGRHDFPDEPLRARPRSRSKAVSCTVGSTPALGVKRAEAPAGPLTMHFSDGLLGSDHGTHIVTRDCLGPVEITNGGALGHARTIPPTCCRRACRACRSVL